MMEHLSESWVDGRKSSQVIQQAVNDVIKSGPLPKDLGGVGTTIQVAESVIKALIKRMKYQN